MLQVLLRSLAPHDQLDLFCGIRFCFKLLCALTLSIFGKALQHIIVITFQQ